MEGHDLPREEASHEVLCDVLCEELGECGYKKTWVCCLLEPLFALPAWLRSADGIPCSLYGLQRKSCSFPERVNGWSLPGSGKKQGPPLHPTAMGLFVKL